MELRNKSAFFPVCPHRPIQRFFIYIIGGPPKASGPLSLRFTCSGPVPASAAAHPGPHRSRAPRLPRRRPRNGNGCLARGSAGPPPATTPTISLGSVLLRTQSFITFMSFRHILKFTCLLFCQPFWLMFSPSQQPMGHAFKCLSLNCV